ncbi:hypothetical protein V6Z12_D04G051000 [Gossypium hirsutum]
MVGRLKKEAFQHFKDRFKRCIDSWNVRFLYQGGKEVFIKSMLQTIPTYAMQCFLLPSSLCKELESIMYKFLWQKIGGMGGMHWCSSAALCNSKLNGGMGFQDLAKFNIALLAK